MNVLTEDTDTYCINLKLLFYIINLKRQNNKDTEDADHYIYRTIHNKCTQTEVTDTYYLNI